MKKSTKIIFVLILSVVIICILSVSCFMWHTYRQKYIKIQQEISQIYSEQELLSSLDCLVLSGNKDAYSYCNQKFADHVFRYDSTISSRDYLLYCYIFAIRDKNSGAAAEFASYYLSDLHEGKIKLDTSMIRVVEKFSKKVLSDSASAPLSKFLCAFNLHEIYSGKLSNIFRDSTLWLHYKEEMSKH